MPKIPTKSPATGQPLPAHYIHTTNGHFVDQSSRVRILRGVNLCGSSKSPVGKPSWQLEGFWEAVEAGDGTSFVGRPLELTKEEICRMDDAGGDEELKSFGSLGEGGEADVHLARLRGWGFTLLRFVFTWESLEHAGPKKYDEAFIAHLILILRKCKSHGFLVFLDPHQDIWSRFLGGSGAPYWTLLACGINPRSLTATQSALLQNEYPVPSAPAPETFPAMIWGTNYFRLANQTIFTLFFAGRDYAPKCVIDGVNVQDWLQGHFIGAVAHLAMRIKEAGGLLDECVVGWDSMNEPHGGLVGWENVTTIPTAQALKKGSTPTFAQSMRLGMGMKQEGIEWWDFGSFGPRRNGSVDIDPMGVRLWVEQEVADESNGVNGRWGWKRDKGWKLGECIWAQHGVWVPPDYSRSIPTSTSNAPTSAPPSPTEQDPNADILIPDYFLYSRKTTPGQPLEKVNFIEEYFLPHIQAYFAALRVHQPELVCFVQPPVFHRPPWLKAIPEVGNGDESGEEDQEDGEGEGGELLLKGRGCYSTHYYDGLTLMTRHWNWFNADALGVLRGKYASPVLAVKIGEKAIRKSIREQLGVLKGDCAERMGEYPTVIGEIGIPFELDDGYAYGGPDGRGKGRDDYREHVKALDCSLSAADGENTLSFTVWTYCPDSSHKWGDGWNGEDLSLWCGDDERKGGSVTGRRITQGRAPSYIQSQTYARRVEKDRAQMIIRPATDTDTEEDGNQEAQIHDEVPQDAIPEAQEHEGDFIGYQVSSTTITYTDLVSNTHSASSSLAASTMLAASSSIDPSSSRATLLPAYTPLTNPLSKAVTTLDFPAFKSAPLAFAFLTNGARAWKASIRCHPLAVVGMPKGWEWDCQRAVFEMTVRVGADDRSMNGSAHDGDSEGFVEQEEPTVIFVPLVHFAKDEVVKRAFGVPTSTKGRNPPSAKAQARISGMPSTSASAAASRTNLPAMLPLLEDVSTVSLALDPSKTQPGASMEMTPTTSTSTAQTEVVGERADVGGKLVAEEEIVMDDALDLDIQVTGGKWAVEGQTLKWWYPIPTSSAVAAAPGHPHSRPPTAASTRSGVPKINPDGTIEYKITIKRRGGAISFKKLGVPEYLVGLGPRGGEGDSGVNSSSSGGGDSWWQALCCGGCVVC